MQCDCGNGIIDAGILKIKIANSESRGPPKFCTWDFLRIFVSIGKFRRPKSIWGIGTKFPS